MFMKILFIRNFISKKTSEMKNALKNPLQIILIQVAHLANGNLARKNFKLSIGVRAKAPIIFKDNIDDFSTEEYAVIFHGKIFDNLVEEFLFSNISAFRSTYPELMIVLSSYVGDFIDLNRFLDLNVEFIDNVDVGQLQEPFPTSLCQQIETIGHGLMAAEQAKKRYSLKIRVDQSVSPENILRLLSGHFDLFPSGLETISRLFTSSYGTYRHRPLGLSDMFMFGETKYLLAFWKPANPVEYEETTKYLREKFREPLWNGFLIPEVWLAARYLDHLDLDLSSPGFSTTHAWSVYFGVIDSSAIDLVWFKTHEWLDSNYLTRVWFSSEFHPEMGELRFADWLTSYFLTGLKKGETAIFPGV